MVKLSNKQHEQDQSRRVEKLESDLTQQKSRIDRLENRADTLKKELDSLKKKLKNL